jgi:DNA replication protein DnaC
VTLQKSRELHRKIKKAYQNIQIRRAEKFVKNEFDSLKENINQLLLMLESIEESDIDPISFDSIATLASQAKEIAWECLHSLENAADEEKRKATASKQQGQAQDQESYTQPQDFGYERRYLYELSRAFNFLQDFTQSNAARLANIPALLLVGEAGTGKTHLFCDIAKQRVHTGLPTILLLGGHFRHEEPWLQIIRMTTGLPCAALRVIGSLLY